MRVSEGRERVHQQLIFSCGCATASWLFHFKDVGQSWCLVLFPAFNASLSGKTLPGKMELPFFGSFTAVTLKQKADKNGALGHQ